MNLTNRHLLKQYFNFSRKDRNAILILCSLILLAISGNFIADRIQLNSRSDFTEIEKAIQEWENQKMMGSSYRFLFNFDPNSISEEKLDSLLLPEFVKDNIVNYREAGGRFNTPADIQKIYGMTDSIFFVIKEYVNVPDKSNVKTPIKKEIKKTVEGTFDPNEAEMETLTEFGFNRFQAENIIKYRENGGVYYQPSDLLRIYGIDTIFYNGIARNVSIGAQPENNISNVKPAIIYVELNSADSVELIKLNGVGPVFASRIIKYRNLLGGFYSKEQLLEVYNFSEETYSMIENNITVDTTMLKKIRINFAEFGDLLRHPYFKKDQVKAVIDYREKNGSFTSVNELSEKKLLDKKSFRNIKPYLSCR